MSRDLYNPVEEIVIDCFKRDCFGTAADGALDETAGALVAARQDCSAQFSESVSIHYVGDIA